MKIIQARKQKSKYGLTLVLSGLLLFTITILITGCATTSSFNVQVTKPAEINLKDYKKIAIGGIRGEGGNDLTDELTQALIESARFEVLDRNHIQTIMDEHKLNMSGMVDETAAVQIGKFIGSAAMIFGRVSNYKYDEKYSEGTIKDRKGIFHRTYTREGSVIVSVTLQLISVETGKIIISKILSSDDLSERRGLFSFSSSGSGGTSKTTQGQDDLPAEKIDPEPLFANARQLIVQRFMKMIAPYTVNEQVNFITDSDIPELKSGFNMAKIGNWDEAVRLFRKAKNNHLDNSITYYNLGVAYMCLRDYDRAIDELEKAHKIKPDSRYLQEMTRCRSLMQEQRKLEQQL